MEKRILQSIINITEYRDMDSLEYGLIVTIAELLPLNTVSMYKLIDDTPENGIEKIVYLSIGKDRETLERCKQNNVINLFDDNQFLNKCFLEKKEVSYRNSQNNQMHMIVPLICDEKIMSAIEMVSNEDLKKYKELINGIKRIYENYLYILNKSERDKLTGLLNRHSFDTKFNRLIQIQENKKQLENKNRTDHERRLQTNGSSAWLAVIDIDHFKKINDRFGHICGDEVLLILSQKMKAFFRNSDLLFRFGGEEFLVILEPTSPEMAKQTLEKFCKKIASSHFPLVGNITISGGYVGVTDSNYSVTLIERADQALYYAKKNGRNCIHSYESLVKQGKLSKPIENGEVELF